MEKIAHGRVTQHCPTRYNQEIHNFFFFGIVCGYLNKQIICTSSGKMQTNDLFTETTYLCEYAGIGSGHSSYSCSVGLTFTGPML